MASVREILARAGEKMAYEPKPGEWVPMLSPITIRLLGHVIEAVENCPNRCGDDDYHPFSPEACCDRCATFLADIMAATGQE